MATRKRRCQATGGSHRWSHQRLPRTDGTVAETRSCLSCGAQQVKDEHGHWLGGEGAWQRVRHGTR